MIEFEHASNMMEFELTFHGACVCVHRLWFCERQCDESSLEGIRGCRRCCKNCDCSSLAVQTAMLFFMALFHSVNCSLPCPSRQILPTKESMQKKLIVWSKKQNDPVD
jgi:hypothetical protein